jgi:putative FmdB family regulatory protein
MKCECCGGDLIECALCGSVIPKNHARQKYCERCSEKIAVERNKEACRRRYQKNKRKIAKKRSLERERAKKRKLREEKKMPIYEYQCLNDRCGHRFEKMRPVNFQDQPVECPECTWPSKRLLSSPALLDNKGTKLRRKLDKKESRTP